MRRKKRGRRRREKQGLAEGQRHRMMTVRVGAGAAGRRTSLYGHNAYFSWLDFCILNIYVERREWRLVCISWQGLGYK